MGVYSVTASATVPGGYPSDLQALTNQNGTDLVYIDLQPAPMKLIPHPRWQAPHPKPPSSHLAMLRPKGPHLP